MPPKKGKLRKNPTNRSSGSEDGTNVQYLDAQYNPEVVNSLLQELKKQMETKCNHIQSDADFMITSMQEAFHLELIKLPTQVKKMPLSRFKEEFGDSLEAVTRGAMGGGASKSTAHGSSKSHYGRQSGIFQTPSVANKFDHGVTETPSARYPKQGETLLSQNGSPLGIFSGNTVVKPKGGAISIMPTPGSTSGVFVPLESGEVINVDYIDTLPEDAKQDALTKMQSMMSNMQQLMSKLGAK